MNGQKLKTYRKQFTFDLKCGKNSPLYKYYNNTAEAYKDIKNFMETNGFTHRQYSVYASKRPMSNSEVRRLIFSMCCTLPWLSECTKKFDVTNIDRKYTLMNDIIEGCEYYKGQKDEWLKRMETEAKNQKEINAEDNDDIIEFIENEMTEFVSNLCEEEEPKRKQENSLQRINHIIR